MRSRESRPNWRLRTDWLRISLTGKTSGCVMLSLSSNLIISMYTLLLSIENQKSQSKCQNYADESWGQIWSCTLVVRLIAQGCVTQTQGVLDAHHVLCSPVDINTSWIVWIRGCCIRSVAIIPRSPVRSPVPGLASLLSVSSWPLVAHPRLHLNIKSAISQIKCIKQKTNLSSVLTTTWAEL